MFANRSGPDRSRRPLLRLLRFYENETFLAMNTSDPKTGGTPFPGPEDPAQPRLHPPAQEARGAGPLESGARRGRAALSPVRAPARPLELLVPGRGQPHRGVGGPGGRAGAAGPGPHRPRRPLRRRPLRQGLRQEGHQAGVRRRGAGGEPPPPADSAGAGAAPHGPGAPSPDPDRAPTTPTTWSSSPRPARATPTSAASSPPPTSPTRSASARPRHPRVAARPRRGPHLPDRLPPRGDRLPRRRRPRRRRPRRPPPPARHLRPRPPLRRAAVLRLRAPPGGAPGQHGTTVVKKAPAIGNRLRHQTAAPARAGDAPEPDRGSVHHRRHRLFIT